MNNYDDLEVFNGKNLSSLFNDIYKNSKEIRMTINTIVSNLVNGIKPDSITGINIGMIIKDYIDVAVKNDEQLIKLANVVQKLYTSELRHTDSGDGDGNLMLSLEEKKQLLANATNDFKDLLSNQTNVKENLEKIEDKNKEEKLSIGCDIPEEIEEENDIQ